MEIITEWGAAEAVLLGAINWRMKDGRTCSTHCGEELETRRKYWGWITWRWKSVWEDNIKIDLREKGCQNSVWIEMAQEYVRTCEQNIYKLILEKQNIRFVVRIEMAQEVWRGHADNVKMDLRETECEVESSLICMRVGCSGGFCELGYELPFSKNVGKFLHWFSTNSCLKNDSVAWS